MAKDGDDVGVVLPLYQDLPQEYREKLQYQGNFIVPVGVPFTVTFFSITAFLSIIAYSTWLPFSICLYW